MEDKLRNILDETDRLIGAAPHAVPDTSAAGVPVADIEQGIRDVNAAMGALRSELGRLGEDAFAGACDRARTLNERLHALRSRRRKLEDRLVRFRASRAAATGGKRSAKSGAGVQAS